MAKNTHPIVAKQGGEVRCLEVVNGVHEFGAVECIQGSEGAAREEAQLQELGDGVILGGFGRTEEEPAILLLLQSLRDLVHMLVLFFPLIVQFLHQGNVAFLLLFVFRLIGVLALGGLLGQLLQLTDLALVAIGRHMQVVHAQAPEGD